MKNQLAKVEIPQQKGSDAIDEFIAFYIRKFSKIPGIKSNQIEIEARVGNFNFRSNK